MSQSHTFAHSCLLGSAETHYLLRPLLTGYESSTASNMDRCTSSLTVGLRAGCVASPWRVSWRGSRAAGRAEQPYLEFSDAVEKALAQAEVRDVVTVLKAADAGQWQAAAWRLERI